MNKKRFLAFTSLLLALLIFAAVSASDNDGQDDQKPVSYTHLTLPTIYSV